MIEAYFTLKFISGCIGAVIFVVAGVVYLTVKIAEIIRWHKK